MAEAVNTTVITGRRTNSSEIFTSNRPYSVLFCPGAPFGAPPGSPGGLFAGGVPGGGGGGVGEDCCTVTLPPGATVSWPVTMTDSPAATPLVTTTSSPCRCPSVTMRISAVLSGFTTYTNGPCWLICVACFGI